MCNLMKGFGITISTLLIGVNADAANWGLPVSKGIEAVNRTEGGHDAISTMLGLIVIAVIVIAIIAIGVHLGNSGKQKNVNTHRSFQLSDSSRNSPPAPATDVDKAPRQKQMSSIPSNQSKTKNRVCTGCGNPYAAGKKFCANCGASTATAAVCSGCNATLEPNAQFCGDCGAKVS